MKKEEYHTLENFMLTWFHHGYDLVELEDRLQRMKELDALNNILDIQVEIKRLDDDHISLVEVNSFLNEIETRTFTAFSFVEFKHTIQSFQID